MNLEIFNYELPEILIAQKPIFPRDKCRLLVLDKEGIIAHKKFSDIIDYLNSGDVLVLNSTKVIHAKLAGKKSSGSPAEIILTRKISELEFECHIKTKNPVIGTKIFFEDKKFVEIIAQKSIDIFIIKFTNKEILKKATLPIPPYIKRKIKDSDYQTIFGNIEGSLAAPTAGLHFTKKLLKKIEQKGVKIANITLHVSYGTFKKIDDKIEKHIMDPEYFEITKESAKSINNRQGKLIVVGTTTLKTLESSSKNGKIIPKTGESKLFIYPPFKFKSGIDILITNFHLPKSTLILLTCAFGGTDRIMNAYTVAVKEKYRFYSLGDAMIISKQEEK